MSAESGRAPSPNRDAALDALVDHLVSLTNRARERASPRLTLLQAEALTLIENRPGLPVARLAELLGTGISSTSRLCDRLEAAGLIHRAPRPENRRVVALRVLADGQRLLRGIRDARREAARAALAAYREGGRVARRLA
ncbi:hypothetical protein GCM10010123_00930 [Pilimelia anulata]|uniref:HTH marR-type domain-containing protein n=1 Tax=Pilimelia anulata TaxID=53371 RepID=A0A8J3B6J9_9ACTN|nr:MarR family transcriptional regulator [Pilimelia anulata]GGJ74810.1 hypothetical protein GCM10010123_00930 [Pilimelia anulata]